MSEAILFSRRLRELLADRGESREKVGQRLRYTGGRVGQIMRGEKPSREFVERLVEAYGLDREEWLTVAGFSGAQASDERMEIARAAALEALRLSREYNARDYLIECFDRLGDHYGGPVVISHLEFPAPDTSREAIEAIAARAEATFRGRNAAARAKPPLYTKE